MVFNFADHAAALTDTQTFIAPMDLRILGISADCSACTQTSISADIKDGGTTILDAALDFSATPGTPAVKSTDAEVVDRLIAKGAVVTVEIVSVGAGATADPVVVLFAEDASPVN
jgi:hypothetical protein